MKSSLQLKSDVLKAIAHENRIRILEALRCHETCNCELGPELGIEQSNLSRHLSVLLQTGIVESKKVGVKTFYRVVYAEVFDILDMAQKIVKKQAEAHLAIINQ